MPELASFISRALTAPPEDVAGAYRRLANQSDRIYFTIDSPHCPTATEGP